MNQQLPKTFIVDDEPNACQLLNGLLQPFNLFGAITEFTNAISAFNEIVNQKPDYLFLDIQMPEISGLQLAEKVRLHSPQTKIIYVTAYEKYALEALRQNAYDYLLKPVDKAELVRLVDKLLAEKRNEEVKTIDKSILIHAIEGVYQVKVNDIVYLEAECSYTTVVVNNKRNIVASSNLGKMAAVLSTQQFIRISRKHLVNRNFVSLYKSKENQLIVECSGKPQPLPVTLKVAEMKQLLER